MGRGRGVTGLRLGRGLKPVVALTPVERAAAEVAALSGMSREELAELWEQRFGSAPPRGCGRQLLELAAAYGVQERAFGRVSKAKRRKPDQDQGHDDQGGARQKRRSIAGPAIARAAMKPGTRLVREWNGRTHHVEVAADGFVWNGKTHRSLSVIAREITGAQWSGPRFFGL